MAGMPPIARHLAYGAGGALASFAAARGIGAIRTHLAQRHMQDSLAQMEAENPALRRIPQHKKERAYSAIASYSPDLASDPYVGGEMVLNMARGKTPAYTVLREARQLSSLAGGSSGEALATSIGATASRTMGELANMKTAEYLKAKYGLDDSALAAVYQRTADSVGVEKIAFDWAPVAGAVGAAAVTYAVPAAIDAVRAARVRANRDKYLNEMKQVHPDMRSIPTQDLHIAYNSMAQHTPDVLSDPLLGGQTLKQMAQFRMANVSSLNEISRLRGQRPLDAALTESTKHLARGLATEMAGVRNTAFQDTMALAGARQTVAAGVGAYRNDMSAAVSEARSSYGSPAARR